MAGRCGCQADDEREYESNKHLGSAATPRPYRSAGQIPSGLIFGFEHVENRSPKIRRPERLHKVGLHHVGIGAIAIVRIVVASEQYHRQPIERWFGPRILKHLPTRHVWQAKIENQKIGTGRQQPIAGLATRSRGLNKDVERVKGYLNEPTDDMTVIYGKNTVHPETPSNSHKTVSIIYRSNGHRT
jgi:hypothetical protein